MMPKHNRHITIISYGFMIVFACLLVYFSIFVLRDNSKLLNNPYNKTDDLMADRIKRGNILASGGEILAESLIDSDGNETRSYPYDNIFAHVIGYYDKGRTGLEYSYNSYMLTSTINPVTKAVEELEGKKNPGDSLVTTLDVNMQKCAYQALGSKKGAVIAMEPDTGAILAMVSKPDYNPNTIVKDWTKLNMDEDNSPLLNRATQGLYPPGSTFKTLTLLEYIRENGNYNDYSFKCKGQINIDNYKMNCHNKKAHGMQDIKQAFANSCNSAFADIGLSLDIKSFRATCRSLLFNTELPFEFQYKQSSFALKKKDSKGEIMQTCIGQGRTLITPLHSLLIISSFANGGYIVAPYIADKMVNDSGNTVRDFSYAKKTQVISQEDNEFMNECLREVVTSGTAASLSGKSYNVYGKTGTAEYDSSGKSHAWFIGYAEKDGKKVAVSIIVEGAGTGSDYAVPIAGKLFDAYY